ncbi:hypothetical protein PAXRUDRAFT_826829 [Paxillus rubicundulus Ve08.2h10]|uniref:Uncharacterized protein n=1 Tax=Paxillus rubicundulus Ve08.2h10 TaxID=930991 RepID=A0A0D0DDZ2_9AGAM|nr:hypothetical protein PAXRUDRAFT_826829 [Paxillus rubicundulus Ve08.2h10]
MAFQQCLWREYCVLLNLELEGWQGLSIMRMIIMRKTRQYFMISVCLATYVRSCTKCFYEQTANAPRAPQGLETLG